MISFFFSLFIMFGMEFFGLFSFFSLLLLWFLSFPVFFFELNFMKYGFVLLSYLLIYILLKISKKSFLEIYFIFFILFVMFFLTKKIFIFFIFFELSLIPTYYLVMKNSTPERSLAGKYLMLYTFFGSFSFLLNILYLGFENGFFFHTFFVSTYFFYFLILAFLIKLPVFFFHLWLPKAHVEASTEGSMILAGILLKLGMYGLLVFLQNMVLKIFLGVFVVFGGIFSGFFGFFQVDLKSFMAYSSILHMCYSVFSSFCIFFFGVLGVVFMGVGHGFMSAKMFLMLSLVYKSTSSRNFFFLNGSLSNVSFLVFFGALCLMMKSSAPLSFGFLGELMMFISGSVILKFWKFFLILFVKFLGGLLSIYFFLVFFHGNVKFKAFKIQFLGFSSVFFLTLFSVIYFPMYFLI